MHGREDKMAQYSVYYLGSKNVLFLPGFVVQVLLSLLEKSQHLGAVKFSCEMRLSVCSQW
jgi:hypothetical protein